mgnify:CR=1 FL=1
MPPTWMTTRGANPRAAYYRAVAAALLWVGGSTVFGLGFGIGFLGEPAPWKGAAAFACWGVSSLMLLGAARLAGIWKRSD